MAGNLAKTDATFDPVRETARARIKIIDRPDGGREFILPALRNFSEKRSFTVGLLFVSGFVALFGFLFKTILNEFPPGVVRFFFLNHLLYFWGFLALIELMMIIAVVDMWLRSSRIVARPGQLQTVTHWLFFRRAATLSTDCILEIKIEGNTSAGATTYYDIVVLTLGTRPGWIAKNFPVQGKGDASYTANEIKSFNSGGKRLNVATGIEGKPEADWFADELCLALALDSRTPPSSNNPGPGDPVSKG